MGRVAVDREAVRQRMIASRARSHALADEYQRLAGEIRDTLQVLERRRDRDAPPARIATVSRRLRFVPRHATPGRRTARRPRPPRRSRAPGPGDSPSQSPARRRPRVAR